MKLNEVINFKKDLYQKKYLNKIFFALIFSLIVAGSTSATHGC